MAILARSGLVSPLPFPVAEAADMASVGHTQAHDNARAIESLYAQHGARIHRFLRDLLGDTTLAKDATQETFVRAFRKLSLLDPTMNVAPWLYGIARNVSLELRKARARAGRYIVGDEDTADAPGTDCPERDYLGREALRVASAALDKLPEERRAMLLLRLDHGLSYDDIAVTMGCSLAKVKVEIFRAREVLRDVMTTPRRAAMSACERAIEVEDMILGLSADDGLVAHVETCADCTDAKAMFLEERALFAVRPALVAPPFVTPRHARVIPLRAYAMRVVPALAGIAAGIAALAFGHPFGSPPRLACESSVPAAHTAPAFDEPLTCESRAFSAPAPAMTLASHTIEHAPLACIAADRATCDLPESMSVTSSLATP